VGSRGSYSGREFRDWFHGKAGCMTLCGTLLPRQPGGVHAPWETLWEQAERKRLEGAIRRRASSHLPEDGVDLRHIQELPGHSNVETTHIGTLGCRTTRFYRGGCYASY